MTPEQKAELRWFFPETLLYAVLVSGYCFAVFHFGGSYLQRISREHRVEYAVLALVLMLVQGFVLERCTHAIITRFRREKKAVA